MDILNQAANLMFLYIHHHTTTCQLAPLPFLNRSIVLPIRLDCPGQEAKPLDLHTYTGSHTCVLDRVSTFLDLGFPFFCNSFIRLGFLLTDQTS